MGFSDVNFQIINLHPKELAYYIILGVKMKVTSKSKSIPILTTQLEILNHEWNYTPGVFVKA